MKIPQLFFLFVLEPFFKGCKREMFYNIVSTSVSDDRSYNYNFKRFLNRLWQIENNLGEDCFR